MSLILGFTMEVETKGFGGYKYDGRWKQLIPRIVKKYKLDKNSRVLKLVVEKVFLKDLKTIVPGIKIYGIEGHILPN